MFLFTLDEQNGGKIKLLGMSITQRTLNKYIIVVPIREFLGFKP